MSKPNALVLTGYGINCDEETRYAFDKAGALAKIVHINDIISNPLILDDYQIFVFPGGFSYGDDTGSGKAMANRIKNNLLDEFIDFIERDTLMLGICNGFQIMVNLGIIPGLKGIIGDAEVSLEPNNSLRYQCRWVDLRIEADSPSIFTRGIKRLHIPVAHMDGNLYAPQDIINKIENNNLVVMRYSHPDGKPADGAFPFNPNGSINDIAAITDKSGRILGMMPHPERNIVFTHRDDWTYQKEWAKRRGISLPEEGEGMSIFRNAVGYFL
ncbi:MAG: phosphoribosylformylglycinamidine synthase I [Spirochaetota bacterium]|nr:phosphoribosylformylglycinamidine synthase I [Spirochaetota bacterium]